MKLARPHLTVLLNALHDLDERRFSVAHPSDAIGDLVEIELGDPNDSVVRVTLDEEEYATACTAVARDRGSTAADDLPERQSYVNAFVAGGVLDLRNHAEVEDFLDRNGNRDLNAGHRPVVVGFDTNLLPWRLADVLGLSPDDDDPVVNGFALATGVRDELDWDYKIDDTGPLEQAFGGEFERVWNQPKGSNREGRLGETYYRRLRDSRYADEVVCDTGDEAIVGGYDEYQQEGRKDVLLFSNDRNFVERARSHRIPAQRVEFPGTLPDEITASWPAIRDTLYVLTVLFGVLVLPKVTLYGIWKGKGGQDWHEERLELDCRSPKIEPLLDRDLGIIEAYEG